MSELPRREESSALPGTTARSPAAGLGVWVLGQMILLGAIWADLQISANPAHTAGRMGLAFLMAGQIILSTALLGDIARTLRLMAVAFAVSFPITQLVGWHCGASAGTSLLYSVAMVVWMAGLWGWMRAGQGERARVIIAAGPMLWVVGTPLLWYVLGEFGAGEAVRGTIAAVSPVMVVGEVGQLLIVVAGHAIVAALGAGVAHYIRSRRTPTLTLPQGGGDETA